MIITEVEALDLLAQLGKETIETYEAEDATVGTIVAALIAFQVRIPAITVGTIHADYIGLTRSIRVDGDSILRALYQLQETVGGYIYADNDRALQWTKTLGEDKGQQIRYNKNLKGITREINYATLVNRLYAYGAGEGTARIKLSDAGGHAEDYVEDGTSQAAWGGIYPKVVTDRRITHPDTLLAWANLKLADWKNPVTTYIVNIYDLSHSIDLDFSFDEIQLGSTITVIDEDLGIDVSVIVVSINPPDLLDPQNTEIELSTRTKDISDTLVQVYDKQQFDEHIATEIGAGQVIVKGVFTVLDWATAGETTINGANIETGTVTLGMLNFVALTSSGTTTEILATINASAEGLKITADRIVLAGVVAVTDDLESSNYVAATSGWQIKGDGDAELNNVIVRGNIQAGADSVIAAGYLTGGTITAQTIILDGAAAILKSTNYSAAVAGWQIEGDGDAEFNTITVRGNIQAGVGSEISAGYLTAGTITAQTIDLDGATAIIGSHNFVPATTGWVIDGIGYAEFNDVVIRGTVLASAGEFTGTLKASDIEAGKTLTVNGTIVVTDKVTIDTNGITIEGERLIFTESATTYGKIGGNVTYGFIFASENSKSIKIDSDVDLIIMADEATSLHAGAGENLNLHAGTNIVCNDSLVTKHQDPWNDTYDIGASTHYDKIYCETLYYGSGEDAGHLPDEYDDLALISQMKNLPSGGFDFTTLPDILRLDRASFMDKAIKRLDDEDAYNLVKIDEGIKTARNSAKKEKLKAAKAKIGKDRDDKLKHWEDRCEYLSKHFIPIDKVARLLIGSVKQVSHKLDDISQRLEALENEEHS